MLTIRAQNDSPHFACEIQSGKFKRNDALIFFVPSRHAPNTLWLWAGGFFVQYSSRIASIEKVQFAAMMIGVHIADINMSDAYIWCNLARDGLAATNYDSNIFFEFCRCSVPLCLLTLTRTFESRGVPSYGRRLGSEGDHSCFADTVPIRRCISEFE